MNQKPKLAVIGAGAIGNLLAALWARAGEDVTLVVRSERVEALRASGLHASGIAGEFHVAPHVATEIPDGTHYAVFAMKTQDLAHAVRTMNASLGTATIVTTQNGVRAREIVRAECGVEPVTATLLLNSSTIEPGTVRYNRAGDTVLGAVDHSKRHSIPELKRLFEIVAPVFVTDRIEGAMWSKLVINALTNSLQALTNKPLNECVHDPVISDFAIAQLKESFGVARAAGIALINMPGAPMKLFSSTLKLPAFIGKMILRKNLGSKEQEMLMTSTLQSLLRKQPTEIDYLNGEFVRLGEKINFPTPVNRAIVEAVKKIERGGAFLSRDEIAGMIPR